MDDRQSSSSNNLISISRLTCFIVLTAKPDISSTTHQRIYKLTNLLQ